jgi:membrane protein YqaA with SNARE-associated domain
VNYLTLFIVAFASATLLPMGSEALLLYEVSQEQGWWLLWLVATLGNSVGSMVNYALGYKGERYLQSRGYLSFEKIEKYQRFFRLYGGWTLLLSWLPVVGDPLTLIAGVFRYPFGWFVLLVTLAKGVRYGMVIFLASSLSV